MTLLRFPIVLHEVMRRRCAACAEPFTVSCEPATVAAYTCADCHRADRAPVAGWVHAWERSKRIQRAVRDDDRRRRGGA